MARTPPPQVIQRVRETIRRGLMLSGGETIVVATSGGPDSTALLHLLRRLEGELGLRLRAVYVDHGLHRASAEHGLFVRRTGRAWGIPVSVCRVNVRAHARRHRLTLEEAARALRYRALARVARRVGASHIAVGHTADDQVETVLLWLVRGAGADGLAGMPATRPHDGLRIIRPLLDLWREDLISYLTAEGVAWRTDPTNRSRGPLRNRIRQDLLPRLAGYNPGVKAVLRRLALQVADDAALLDRLADDAARETVRCSGSTVVIDAARFGALPVAVQRRVAYRALHQARGNNRGLAFVHIERIRSLACAGRPGERADLPGLRAERTAGEVEIACTRTG
ncbi:MAG: tRNA lysidine(34) synthetase TilS [Armatimonadetes bacterium]|nr:tRNA lysidine(34) synthetase TilS [Armatimonadota bacterium]